MRAPERARPERGERCAGQEYDGRVVSVVDELRGIRLFSRLSQRQLRQLARLAKERQFRPGVVVVKENTMSGVGMFIVVDGEALVSVDGSEVARIGPGDHFGELALITEDARTATVTAATSLRCYMIAFWDFRKFAKENPDLMWKLLQHLAALLTAERERHARASLLSS